VDGAALAGDLGVGQTDGGRWMLASWAPSIVAGVLSLQVVPSGTIDWPAVERAFREFALRPTAVNADAIRAVVPVKSVAYVHSPTEKAAMQALDELLPQLLDAVDRRDRTATGLALDLLWMADGHLAEEILAALTSLITARPRLFLQELEARPRMPPEHILTFMGEAFADAERDVRCRELEERKRALASVEAPGVAVTRQRCLKVLEVALNKCE
jgi:hypothetical protein